MRFEQRRSLSGPQPVDERQELADLVGLAERERGLERLDDAELDRQEGDAERLDELERAFGRLECFAGLALGPEDLRLGEHVADSHLDVLAGTELGLLVEPPARRCEVAPGAEDLDRRRG